MAKRIATPTTPTIESLTSFELFEAPLLDEEIAKLRKQFLSVANILLRHMPRPEFDLRLRVNVEKIQEANPQLSKAEAYLQAVNEIKVPCDKPECHRGMYRGQDTCYRCVGKGYQTVTDLRRNWGYDQFMTD